MDHCEIGCSISGTWNFMPSFIDVLHYHHEPSEAEHDPKLVEIVAAVEHFLWTKAQEALATEPSGTQENSQASDAQASESGSGASLSFPNEKRHPVVEILEEEYNRVLPLVELGLTAPVGAIG